MRVSPALVGLTGLVLVTGLTACATPSVDTEALDAWQERMSDLELPSDGLATMQGATRPSDAESPRDEGITATLPHPAAVTTIEFSCFGEGSMSLSITSSGPESGAGATTDPLACAESPHDLGRVGIATGAGITSINASVTGSDRESAWRVVVHGDDSGSDGGSDGGSD